MTAALSWSALAASSVVPQTLLEVGSHQNSTIVFPLPLDLVKAFLDRMSQGPESGAGGGGAIAYRYRVR
jgi:hypothetical protein